MYLRLILRTVSETHTTDALQLTPPALTVHLTQPCDITNPTARRNRFYIFNLADKLEDNHDPMMRLTPLRFKEDTSLVAAARAELGGKFGAETAFAVACVRLVVRLENILEPRATRVVRDGFVRLCAARVKVCGCG
jgi:hypothetical protein